VKNQLSSGWQEKDAGHYQVQDYSKAEYLDFMEQFADCNKAFGDQGCKWRFGWTMLQVCHACSMEVGASTRDKVVCAEMVGDQGWHQPLEKGGMMAVGHFFS